MVGVRKHGSDAISGDSKVTNAPVRKHKMDFRKATTVFRDQNQLTLYDEDHSEQEDRWITMGIDSTGVVRVIIHTYEQIGKSLNIRIISA